MIWYLLRIPVFASTIFNSGAETEKACLDDLSGAGRRRKADRETGEDCRSGWNLYMGKSSLRVGEARGGIENRKN